MAQKYKKKEHSSLEQSSCHDSKLHLPYLYGIGSVGPEPPSWKGLGAESHLWGLRAAQELGWGPTSCLEMIMIRQNTEGLCEALAVTEAIRRMGLCPSLSSSPHPHEYFGSNKAQEKFKGGNTLSNPWKVTSMQERQHDPEKKQYVSGWRSKKMLRHPSYRQSSLWLRSRAEKTARLQWNIQRQNPSVWSPSWRPQDSKAHPTISKETELADKNKRLLKKADLSSAFHSPFKWREKRRKKDTSNTSLEESSYSHPLLNLICWGEKPWV